MKEWSNEYHPFNPNKHFSQIYRWKEFGNAPASISLDPSNVCQLNCEWCNSAYIKQQNPKMISKDALLEIVDLLTDFSDLTFKKVEAVCIAGGGEPLINPHTQDFIDKCKEKGIQTGVITNGINLPQFDLSSCEWVGISVDSGCRETYKKLKGMDKFDEVINNIKNLVKVRGRISTPGYAHGVTYKFVMTPDNINDIYSAVKIAKEIGCRAFHLRPFGIPYKAKDRYFTDNDIKKFRIEFEKSRKLEDEDFKIYGITHKFDGKFKKCHNFKKCYATGFSATFEPPTKNGFNVSLCCDRRGDKSLTIENTNKKDFKKFWGSKYHKKMIDNINLNSCPRCTRGPHNIIYEKTIKEDNLGYEFG